MVSMRHRQLTHNVIVQAFAEDASREQHNLNDRCESERFRTIPGTRPADAAAAALSYFSCAQIKYNKNTVTQIAI